MDGYKIRLGRIGYLNVLPVYYPLEQGDIEHNFSLIYGTPAELNEMIRRGLLDISVVSSIEYARHYDRYIILPDLSISARDKVKSVLLLSKTPIENISVIHTTPHSHASVALMEILMSEVFGRDCKFVQSAIPLWQSKTSSRPEAYMAIGDEALYWLKKGEYPYHYDLASLWWKWTKKPFVFALWVCKKEAFLQNPDTIASCVETLINAKLHGLKNLHKALEQASGTTFLTLYEMQEYFSLLDYNLAESNIDGLTEYFSLLVKHSCIDSMPPINILEWGGNITIRQMGRAVR